MFSWLMLLLETKQQYMEVYMQYDCCARTPGVTTCIIEAKQNVMCVDSVVNAIVRHTDLHWWTHFPQFDSYL